MEKKHKFSAGQKAIITVGAFVITFLTICTFFKSDISFLLTSRSVERKYGNTSPNSYFIEDNFNYVNAYEGLEVNSKEEIIGAIYYLINSGITSSERYCGKGYDNCYNDMNAISGDENLLSLLNNFVHPYNSFNSISFNYNDDVIQIEIEHVYSEDEIKEINTIVDNVINDKLTNNMATKEKIKVIHDYIIDNADYDTLKTNDVNDDTYKSNTAYGVLVQGYGICSGYSDAMAIFLDKLNIINYKISNDQHIWNLVFLDDEWLHLDLTWDDPVSDKNVTRDNYFLITTKTLGILNDNVHYYNINTFVEAN